MFRAQVLVKKKHHRRSLWGHLSYRESLSRGDRSLDPMQETVVIDTFFAF